MTTQFAYSFLLPYLSIMLLITLGVKVFWQQVIFYRFGLAGLLRHIGARYRLPARTILFVMRSLVLLMLMLLIMRPQQVDQRSEININGVDIMLALDLSGSMELFDDPNDREERITTLKREARNFIDRRKNDQIGVVLFGKQALSRLPLTLDKPLLHEIVSGLTIDEEVSSEGTALLTGLALAANRLRGSQAKSKVIILLTDGISNADTIRPSEAIQVIKKLGIKVYTIGIGREEGGFTFDQFGNLAQADERIDTALLKKIARASNGRFFRVHNKHEMKEAYEVIDTLERSETKTKLYNRYYELFEYFIWPALILLLLELFLRFFWWRGIW